MKNLALLSARQRRHVHEKTNFFYTDKQTIYTDKLCLHRQTNCSHRQTLFTHIQSNSLHERWARDTRKDTGNRRKTSQQANKNMRKAHDNFDTTPSAGFLYTQAETVIKQRDSKYSKRKLQYERGDGEMKTKQRPSILTPRTKLH